MNQDLHKDFRLPEKLTTNSVTSRIDHNARVMLAKLMGGTSPIALNLVFMDWALNLGTAPGKQMKLTQQAQEAYFEYLRFLFEQSFSLEPLKPTIEPELGDRRFKNEAWNKPPFSFYKQGFLLTENWWKTATTNISGLTEPDEKAISFTARQLLNVFAPSNFLATNPELLSKTIEEKGANLVRGLQAFSKDALQIESNGEVRTKSNYQVGKTLAATPGQVVYRNHLIELIQYEPTTKTVHPEPLLFVPAWIMKYYILDLSAQNSMVKYLTSQGFTVFMISWRNPDANDAHIGFEDYLKLGPLTALDEIERLTSAKKIHTAGYCLGGTLLSVAAASLAREGDNRLASMTLFAAQTDFSEAGELMLFINESQVSFLEDMMQEQGYLDATQMTGAFQLLRSNDLLWARLQKDYLLGETTEPNDLMTWNEDATRMPFKMHSEYLRKFFLSNELARGKYEVAGKPISLRDVHIPIFAVGTETDHVAPWKSVFKIHSLCHADVTFALTNGGHNAGVISEVGHPRRHFRVLTNKDKDHALSPDEWLNLAELKDGSWWPEWKKWLVKHSTKRKAPPKLGKSLCPAPGTYVNME